MHSRYLNFIDSRTAKLSIALLASVAMLTSMNAVFAAPRLVTEDQARHLGLERAWNAQVRVDAARNEVERAILEGDRLTVLTTAGVVQEIDALTGKTVWTAQIGNPDYPSLGPAASDKYVAVVNGSTLYVLDRADGKPLMIRRVGGAPGAAPAVGKSYVFVPLALGRIEAYPIGEQKLTPWYYQSFGRSLVRPITTPESFVWTTDSGYLYVGSAGEKPGVRFRLETNSDIMAAPSYGAPYVYVATADGEVFAMHERTGQQKWKYATGYPVTRSPAVVGEKVYVTSNEPTLHCVDAKTGEQLWEASHVAQFAAASDKRVYGVDELGALLVIDATNGKILGRIPTDPSTNALVNDQTDWIYLVSQDGVVQCLHEIGEAQPMRHQPKPEAAPSPADAKPAAATDTTAAEADGAIEDTEPAAEMADDEDPEAMPAEEDPFSEF